MVGRREFEVGIDEKGSRLETFLRRQLGLSRPVALKAIRKGWVRVDGKRAKASRHLNQGEVIKITNYGLPLPAIDGPTQPPTAPPDWIEAARGSLLHQDDDLVVSIKPSGRPVHSGSGHPVGWVDAVGALLGKPMTPVGRLDRDTSGLLALAASTLGRRKLFESLKSGELSRTYSALAAGSLEPTSGVIDQPLRLAGGEGEQQMTPHADGKPAQTRYVEEGRYGACTLFHLELITGRKHQIRAHLAHRGCPVLGDSRYGTAASRELTAKVGLDRLFLHAGKLRLPHPATGNPMAFEAPLPTALQRALDGARRGV
jgi:23S rRNA pseudouridine955/2504/2580 synthase